MKRIILAAISVCLFLPFASNADPINSFERMELFSSPGWYASSIFAFQDREGNPALSFSSSATGFHDTHVGFKWMRNGQWEDLSIYFADPNAWTEVAFDLDNLPHAVWLTGSELTYSHFNGQNWSYPIYVSPLDGIPTSGAGIAIDSRGWVHVFWNDGYNEASRLRYWRYFDGASWSDPLLLPGGDLYYDGQYWHTIPAVGGPYVSSVIADNDGRVYVMTSGCKGCTKAAIDSQGNLHKVQSCYPAGTVTYQRLGPNGWTDKKNFDYGSKPSITLDEQDQPHVSYIINWGTGPSETRKDEYIMYAWMNDGVWEGPVNLNLGRCPCDFLKGEIVISPDQKLHLFAETYADEIYHSTIDLNKNVPTDQLWLPGVSPPFDVMEGAKAVIVGERGSEANLTTLGKMAKVKNGWVVYNGAGLNGADETGGIYALPLDDLGGQPITAISSTDKFLYTKTIPPFYTGWDFTGSNIIWAWWRSYLSLPTLIQGIDIEDGATVIDNVEGGAPQANDKYVAYTTYIRRYGSTRSTDVHLRSLEDGSDQVLAYCGVYGDSRIMMSDDFLVYRCKYSYPWTARRLSDGRETTLEITGSFIPLIERDRALYIEKRDDGTYGYIMLSLQDGSTTFLPAQLGDIGGVPLAFSEKYIVVRDRSNREGTELFVYDLDQPDLPPRKLYQDLSQEQKGVNRVSIDGDKILITDFNRCGHILVDTGPPIMPPAFTASYYKYKQHRFIYLEWETSPSPDVAEYRIYKGDNIGGIDYDNVYATVAHPEYSLEIIEMDKKQDYCFALRAVDDFGLEESGPGQVDCIGEHFDNITSPQSEANNRVPEQLKR